MLADILLPALSAGMEEGVIARWLKSEGDPVAKGEPIAEIETDKVTMELEAEAKGILGPIIVAKGMRAGVNQVIARLHLAGEHGTAPMVEALAKPAPVAVPAPPASPTRSGDMRGGTRERRKASPLARRTAAQNGIQLGCVVGTGPNGRIVRADIDRLIAARLPGAATDNFVSAVPARETPAPAATIAGVGRHDIVPHSAMRRTIARRLAESKRDVPHFYLNADCNLEALLALRAEINASCPAAERISVNDFVVKAVARALRAVPDANVIWTDEAILRFHEVDVSVAVAIPGGLVTPVIRNADRKSIGTISAEIKRLAELARENKLKPEHYQGGSFSVSNLGMYGVKSFSAIINPPQSGILSIGTGEARPIVQDGKLAHATMMSVTLSADHRAVDGALAAQLLASFKASIEAPLIMLV